MIYSNSVSYSQPRFGAVSGEVVEATLRGRPLSRLWIADVFRHAPPKELTSEIGVDGSALVTGETPKGPLKVLVKGTLDIGRLPCTRESVPQLNALLGDASGKVDSHLLETWWARTANRQVFEGEQIPTYHPGPNLFTNPLDEPNPFGVVDGNPGLTIAQPTPNPGEYTAEIGGAPIRIKINSRGYIEAVQPVSTSTQVDTVANTGQYL